jgi:hypothetical protein
MDRDRLKGYLDDAMSLEQISALVGRHPSTVAYWLKKHGLEANGRGKYAARGSLTRQQLEPLVESGASLREMADAHDRSISTIRYWLDRFGLEVSGRRGKRPRVPRSKVEAALRDGSRTLLAECEKHGWSVFVIENSGRTRCRRCRMERVAEWRRRVKRKLVEEAGGCCRLCGYDRHMGSLEFHHLDPSKKSFALSLRGVTRSISELRREAAKCVLLCANCHAEVEGGYASLPE